MNYHIYINEKNISSNYSSAYSEFTKRLSAYCNTTVHTDTTLKITRAVNKNGHIVLIITEGESTNSSIDFANYINNIQLTGISVMHVIIGYPLSYIYEQLSAKAPDIIPDTKSITSARLSNETVALLFLEQLYRGYTIIQGKTYHK